MTDHALSRAGDRVPDARRATHRPASGWSGQRLLIVARVAVLMALIVLVCGSFGVIVSGTTPSPGLPPFLVQGEDATTGVSVSRLLPLILAIAGGLGIVGLRVAKQPVYISWWLTLLAVTWALAWVSWNFAPERASALIVCLLLLVNGISTGGAWRLLIRSRSNLHAKASWRHAVWRRASGSTNWWPHLALGAVTLGLLGGAISAPAVARRIAVQPRGTLATIAISAPPEVDDATIVSDPRSGHTVVLLRSSYIAGFDSRVIAGTLITLDSRRGMIVHSVHLNFYPGTLAVDNHIGRAFINAVVVFGMNTALNRLWVLDLRTGTITRRISLGTYLIDTAIDQRTNRVFVADWDEHSIRILDGQTATLLRTVRVGRNPTQVVVAANTNRVFVVSSGEAGNSGLVSLLNASSGAIVRKMPSDVSNYVFAVDDRIGRIFGATDNTVNVWDAKTGVTLGHSIISGGRVSALAVSNGTHRVFVVNSAHSVSMLDARSGRVLRTVRVGVQPTALAVDDRVHRVFVVNTASDSVSVLDATTGKELDTLSVGVKPIAIGIDSHLSHAFVYNAASDTVTILDTHSGLRHS